MGTDLIVACGGPIKAKDAPWWLDSWPSNGDLIDRVARLGYLDGRVLDATYGLGTFWKVHRPDDLWTNDRDVPGADYQYDYREFPGDWIRSFDSVVFDPDYKLNGTPALGEFDRRYGIGGKVTRQQRYDAILAGAVECARVAKRYVLVKCQDQVESGRQWWMGDDVTKRLAEVEDDGVRVGWAKVEEFFYLGGTRKQPSDRDRKCPDCKGAGSTKPTGWDTLRACEPCDETGRVPSEQEHAHARPSKLLIFKRPGRVT